MTAYEQVAMAAADEAIVITLAEQEGGGGRSRSGDGVGEGGPTNVLGLEEIGAGTGRRPRPHVDGHAVGAAPEVDHVKAGPSEQAPDGHDGLDDLSLRLARVPCSPLYQRHVSPDHELAALLTRPRPG